MLLHGICRAKFLAKGLNIMCSNCNCESDKCRIAVTVENNFAPCTFPESYFGVEIKSRDGKCSVSGRVAGGGSAVFAVPCGGDYTVTVTGGENSSPRAQTRRVNCCCGQTAGVTFIFMTYEPDCEPKFYPPAPPCCPPPCCHPPKPPKPLTPPPCPSSLLEDILDGDRLPTD